MKHYLLIRSIFSSGWTLALILREIQPLSARLLPETNSMLSSGCLLLGVSLSTRLTWLFTYEMGEPRGGGYRIRNSELDWKDWTSCWFHTDYFITECLFSIRLTSFESRHFHLSIDITPMSVCWVFAELQFILVTYFKEQLAETEKTESTSCLFSFFFQKELKGLE